MHLKLFLLLIWMTVAGIAVAQIPDEIPIGGRSGNRNIGQSPNSNIGRKDTIGFVQRDDSKDSISVIFRYLDSTNRQTLDSSINDFDAYYSVPSSYQYLGNNGAAAYSLIFKPLHKAGFDAGFHAFDIYRFTPENTKFYKTRKAFSFLGYQLASGTEQMIQASHTQNPRPNINFGFDYKLISAPGLFVTQNNTNNAIRFFSSYQGKRKRYNGAVIFVANTVKAAQNGGIVNDELLLNPNNKERFSIPVNLGDAQLFSPNPFQTKVNTGNIYKEGTFFLRQSFDVGKKDSVAINDSTTEYLFYPKLRLQHTFSYSSSNYLFNDFNADSAVYKNWYNINLQGNAIKDTLIFRDKWNVISNDFSILQFPDTKNPSQFLLAGITLQNIQGNFTTGSAKFYNAMVHGEYRNRTRNKLWDLLLQGSLYATGFNSGDYNAFANVSRYLSKKLGSINLFFINTNRTPSFIFDNRSSYNLSASANFKKENIISFGGKLYNPFVNLSFSNHLITNYSYFSNYYQKAQYNKPINIVQIAASKKIKLRRNIYWYADATVQQTDAAAPIKVPLIFSRNRFAYEGKLFKNLVLSTGIELRYFTPYKAYNFSPVIAQFIPQDSVIIYNKPDIAAFLHFRIKGFTGYLRAENLNTLSFKNGFGFADNNFAAPHYPSQGQAIRFGIRWWFVN